MELNGWTSLYIPYLDPIYTVDELTHIFEVKYAIGKVKRIDIVWGRVKSRLSPKETNEDLPSQKDSDLRPMDSGERSSSVSFLSKVSNSRRTAFVHFHTWYLNDFTIYLRNQLEIQGKYNMCMYMDYLYERLEQRGNCKKCVSFYHSKLDILERNEISKICGGEAVVKSKISGGEAVVNSYDNIPLAIHRTKQLHIHTNSYELRSPEFPRTPSAARPEYFTNFEVSCEHPPQESTNAHAKDEVSRENLSNTYFTMADQHDKRIELLEEQVNILVEIFGKDESLVRKSRKINFPY
jgi:hypothetical protein